MGLKVGQEEEERVVPVAGSGEEPLDAIGQEVHAVAVLELDWLAVAVVERSPVGPGSVFEGVGGDPVVLVAPAQAIGNWIKAGVCEVPLPDVAHPVAGVGERVGDRPLVLDRGVGLTAHEVVVEPALGRVSPRLERSALGGHRPGSWRHTARDGSRVRPSRRATE